MHPKVQIVRELECKYYDCIKLKLLFGLQSLYYVLKAYKRLRIFSGWINVRKKNVVSIHEKKYVSEEV